MKLTTVTQYLDTVGPQEREIIEFLRTIIQAAEPELVEGIKWNSPSYALQSNDIITVNTRNYGCVALIFHTGPKGKDTHTGIYPFEAEPEVVTWVADKRFVVRCPSVESVEDKKAVLTSLVRQWCSLARAGF